MNIKFKRGDLASSHCLGQVDNHILGIFLTINSERYQPDTVVLFHNFPEFVFKVVKHYTLDYII